MNAEWENIIPESDEAAVYRLRALYGKYGYTRYKVSKFEEYDLYAHNKNFLICENILTFTDTNGKLMALKPDVTLSIVKNFGRDGADTSKLYYSETVYRTSARSEGFREIRQTGLECIGKVDLYLMSEVIMLAERSLALLSDRYVLDLSHMGFLLGLLSECGVSEGDVSAVLGYIANKNLPGLTAFASSHEMKEEDAKALSLVTSIYEPLETALPKLRSLVRGERTQEAYEELSALCGVTAAWGLGSSLYLDLSIAGDRSYYNGIVFRGYVDGVPEAILLGGRYDSLLSRMGRKAEAIGFAVQPELLGARSVGKAYDVDAVLLYESGDDARQVIEAVRRLEQTGVTVRAECGFRTETRCRTVYRKKKGETGYEAMD